MVSYAVAALVLVGFADGPADGPEKPTPPRSQGKPVEVSIGFFALDFARVTVREESFDVTGYYELNWVDPRLALETPSGARRKLDARRVWTPRILFENALDAPRLHSDPVLEVDDRGKVTSWAIVSGKFSSPMRLRDFPFDRQDLVVKIAAVDDESIVRFRPLPSMVQVDDEAFVTDWTIGRATVKVDAHPYLPGEESYSRFAYDVAVSRRATFYVWRVMVPLSLLALVAWAAFWFEPVGLQPQISTCMAALISLVAFNFAIDFSLPKLAYLTLIDRHALIGFGFVTASVVVVTLVHRAVTSDRVPTAKRIQRMARWLYLPLYAAAVAINLLTAAAG